MKSFPRQAMVALVLLASIGCDQATKRIASAELRHEGVQSFLGDTFRLVYAENPGAFLGLGGTLGESARFWGLTVMVGLMLAAGLVYLAMKGRSMPALFAGGLALILGGGASNWYDRLVNDGRVVDFLNLGIGPVRTGIFNVADIAIMVGAGLIVLAGREKPAQPASNAAA